MARKGVVLSTVSGASYKEVTQLSRIAEEKGWDAVFMSEAMNDALAGIESMALATSRIRVGTWIANIYLRHPALAGASAVAIDELSDGRLILGLGVSHRPLLDALGIEMKEARTYFRSYLETVKKVMAGGPPREGMRIQFRPAAHKIPIYLGALALETVELAGEVADGAMLYLCTPDRVREAVNRLRRGAAKAGRDPETLETTLGIPVYMSDDLEAARAGARANLAGSGSLPFYNRLFHRSGFVQEAAALSQAVAKGDQAAAAAAISDEMADAMCLIGPASRCRERLQAFREAGVQMPILVPNPVKEDFGSAVRKILETFAGN
ncbi:MAG: LLM class flavin-dependent oxidoreductase [Deltaproteobacteria bacterium]|nr:LLM class flavin-dependent oxidoreductase [Deltaproteobacteria bacterium]